MRDRLENIRNRWYHSLIITIMLLMVWGSFTELAAEEPTAIISALNGTVLVSIQGREIISAKTGMTLRAGDSIETPAGTEVVLTLADGSELQISESTKMDIAVLTQNISTQARASKINLWWGAVRSAISPAHQKEGSSYEVETPNALAGVKFSQPIVEVSYDPDTDETTIDAHTVDVVVTNLRTLSRELIPQGRRGVVTRNKISLGSMKRRSSTPSQKPSENIPGQPQQPGLGSPDGALPPGQRGMSGQPRIAPGSHIFRQVRGVVQQATSPMLLPHGGGGGPGNQPQSGGRPERADRQRRVITIHFRQE